MVCAGVLDGVNALLLSFLIFILLVNAQVPSTNTPVPPLQWINLTGLLQGSPAPPLKDAAIGYDENSRSLIIFGGESANGIAQSSTYLLNLDTLTWSVPSPPLNLQKSPAARSAAVAGCDFAASNRHGFVVMGGKGSDGKPLSDVWEYDFINQFWSQVVISPGGPSPRWGASGGIDPSTDPIPDPIVPGPNNTLYYVGGFDGSHSLSLSDVWRLNISGTLSSNLPNSAAGSWDHLTIGTLPSRVYQSGTVLSQRVLVTGGCASLSQNEACATQESYIIDVQHQSQASRDGCPAPRVSPVIVRNTNQFSAAFGSQVFLLLGSFDSSMWQDDNGLANGEVAILDINTGSWSRVLPSGDPGSTGKITFPGPREGAASFAYHNALVGSSRNSSADIIVFGGRDSSGKVLSEVWLLRAYSAILTSSGATWSGSGDGRLQSGINANGAGVSIQYMSKCASRTSSSPGTSTGPSGTNPSPTSSNGSTQNITHDAFDASIVHKVLSPISLIIFQPIFILYRILSPHYLDGQLVPAYIAYRHIFAAVVLAAYVLGVAGVAIAFTSATHTSNFSTDGAVQKSILQTGHSIAGLIFFLCMYGLLPGLLIISLCRQYFVDSSHSSEKPSGHQEYVDSPTADKPPSNHGHSRSAPHSLHNASPPSSPRPRTNSWGPSSLWRRSQEGGQSNDSDSALSAGAPRAFEVLNRPPRNKPASSSWLAVPHSDERVGPRSLSDIDWLQRRRSLNTVGELDYVITQAQRAQMSATPATADALVSNPEARPSPQPFPKMPIVLIHLLIQICVLALCILTLVALWMHAHPAFFAVFLAWSAAFYIAMFVSTLRVCPQNSLLYVLCNRLFVPPPPPQLNTTVSNPSPTPLPGPYLHQPPHQRVFAHSDDASYLNGAPQSDEMDERNDDIDDDTRQRMIEEEMSRRDVSIVTTIPKRKLWITNPS